MKCSLFHNTAQVFIVLIFVSMFSTLPHAQSETSNEAFEKALKLYEVARYNEAATAFKHIIDQNHENAEAYYHLANCYFLMARKKDAVKAYQRTVELKPDHYLAYNNMGAAYHDLQQFREAIKAYEQAIRIKPDYSEAIFGLGVVYLELKDNDAALEQHKRLTAIDVDRADKLYAYITHKKIPLPVLNGKALSLVKPSYPPQARAAHVSGTVLVWVSIDETGKVVSASTLSGPILLRATSLQAAKLARFSPTIFNGKAVRVTGIIFYSFMAQ